MAKMIAGLLVAGLVSLYYAVSWGKDNQLDRSARGCSLAMAVGLLSLAAYFIFKTVVAR